VQLDAAQQRRAPRARGVRLEPSPQPGQGARAHGCLLLKRESVLQQGHNVQASRKPQ